MPSKSAKSSVAKKLTVKKKTVSKKKVAKQAPQPVLTLIEHQHDEDHADHLDEKPIQKFEKRFIFVGTCNNCEHLPMRINKLVALMSVLVAVLSGMVIAESAPLDLQGLMNGVQSISMQYEK